MELKDILQQTTEIFRRVLKNESLVLESETTANDVEGWDSLTNMNLITEVEKHFDIRFKLREIMKLKNVGELCESVHKKLA